MCKSPNPIPSPVVLYVLKVVKPGAYRIGRGIDVQPMQIVGWTKERKVLDCRISGQQLWRTPESVQFVQDVCTNSVVGGDLSSKEINHLVKWRAERNQRVQPSK